MSILKKCWICLIAMAVLFSGSAFAQDSPEGQQARTNFTDVKESHWAAKHIRKLALQDIISGYPDGTFKPESPVTQEEVIAMAIGAMGLGDSADTEAAYVLPLSVSDWARPYVALALEKKLIVPEEERAQISGNETNWGKQEASRQWVTKMIIRAIGQEQQAQEQTEPTEFKDNDEIAAWALGYVNVAVDLGIVSGFDGNVFKPREGVTRAQMATFLSLSEQYMEKNSPHVVKGSVVSMDEGEISILDGQGQAKSYELADDAVFYSAEDHFSQIDREDIEPYNQVYIIQRGGLAYYVEVLSDEVKIEKSEGILSDIDIADMEIYLLEQGELKKYNLASNIRVKDKEGIGMSLSALTKNSKIEVQKSTVNSEVRIVEIVLLEVAVNKTTEAYIQSIDTEDRILMIQETDSDDVEAYPLSDTPVIKYGETYLPSLSELKEGDRVKVIIKDSVIESVELLERSQKVAHSGKINILDKQNRTIVIQYPDNTLGAYRISEEVDVVIKGMSWASLNDLEPGDQVQLEIVNGSVVTKITAEKALPTVIKAKIVNYDAQSGLLTYVDANNSGGAKFITDTTHIAYDGKIIDRDDFQQYFSRNTPIRLEVSENNIVSIELDNQAKGIITKITETSITLKEEDGLTYSYRLNDPTIIIYDDKSNSWDELKVGDRVEISLSSDRKEAEVIRLTQTFILRAHIIDEEDKEILFIDDEGGMEELEIEKDVPIVVAGSNAADLSDIPLHDPLAVTLTGDRVDAVEVLSVKRGIITNVNGSSRTLTFLPYGKNSAEEITFENPMQIYKGFKLYTSPTILNVNDRVEIAEDSSGNKYVIVLSGEKMYFHSYDENKKQVLLRTKRGTMEQAYPLDSNVYVHDGNNKLDLKQFDSFDELIVYKAGRKIVEVTLP